MVCLFPEGALTRTATLQKLNRGYELIARKARVPVMPVWLENVWGSVFSYYGGHFFWKWPRVVPLKVWIYFGAPMTSGGRDGGDRAAPHARHVRSGLPGAAGTALASRPRMHPPFAPKRFFKPVITDAYSQSLAQGRRAAGRRASCSRNG